MVLMEAQKNVETISNRPPACCYFYMGEQELDPYRILIINNKLLTTISNYVIIYR